MLSISVGELFLGIHAMFSYTSYLLEKKQQQQQQKKSLNEERHFGDDD